MASNQAAPDNPMFRDSGSTELDAGLDDPVQDGIEEEATLPAEELDSGLPASPRQEVSSSRVDVESLGDDIGDGDVRSPEMADMNMPGEVDIEVLGDDDLSDTDLPVDARLDPLEE